MLDSFATKNAPLIDRVQAARAVGDERSARTALDELLAEYVLLGNRQAGTVAEQNAYIVARRLGALPDALTELGVTETDLPMAATRRPAPSPAPPHIAERFAHIGRDDEEPLERYHVENRPQDNMRFHGRLQPFAVVDRQDGKPVAWYDNREQAELVAGTVSRLRSSA
ncbi:hypothetical protein [Streptomyces sp. NPDC047315]|uniref:hypothetical protein n=1 Tax=Streptomyces sp. NPDC047315 TaxID=3155142 RepID=UPI0033D67C10